MARVYRDGLEAMRTEFLRKRRALHERDERLRKTGKEVLDRDTVGSLDRTRARLDIPLDDLDALIDADEPLQAYERLIRSVELRVADLRDEHRRLKPLRKAAKVLAALTVLVGAFALIGWQRQQDQRERALAEAAVKHAAQCRASADCRLHGLCSVERRPGPAGGVAFCVAGGDADCATSRGCRVGGRCRSEDGACVASSSADCAASLGCALLGNCSLSDMGCAAILDAQCADTPGCRHHGWCSTDGASCVARTREDCAALCKQAGRCAPMLHQCVATRGDCSRHDCSGPCELRNERCVAENAKSCEDDPMCRYHGLCTPREGQCVVGSSADCASSVGCGQKGRCVAEAERCIVDDASCLRSSGCRELGRCRAEQGQCVDGLPTG